jgi:hypothetical protein
MHKLSFLAARSICLDAIDQCSDLVRNGPLPQPDVLEVVLKFEEVMVLTEQTRDSMSDTEYTSRVLQNVKDFAFLLQRYETNASEHADPYKKHILHMDIKTQRA